MTNKETALQKDVFEEDFEFMLQPIMMIVFITAMSSMVQAIQATQEEVGAQSYVGLTDSRVIHAKPTAQWLNFIYDPPYVGWVGASMHNDGPDSAFIAINNPDEYHEVCTGEDYEVSMAGGQRRIEFLFYKSAPTKKAAVRIIGKY